MVLALKGRSKRSLYEMSLPGGAIFFAAALDEIDIIGLIGEFFQEG